MTLSRAQQPLKLQTREPMTPESTDSANTTSRLDDIEIKIAFAEDLIETLNSLVARQADQIEALGREIVRLKDRLDRSAPDTGSDLSDPVDDRPPHY